MLNDDDVLETFQYTPEQLKHVTRAATGDCPIKFSLFWDLEGCCPCDAAIIAWFWEVREYGLRKGLFYTAEAIAGWAGTVDKDSEFNVFDGCYNDIREVIFDYARAIGDHEAPPREDGGSDG